MEINGDGFQGSVSTAQTSADDSIELGLHKCVPELIVVMRDGGGSAEADRLLVEGGRIWITVSRLLRTG